MSGESQKNISWLQQSLEKIWYQKGKAKWLLLPLTGIYCGLHAITRWKDSKDTTKLAAPIIVVGNISIGGTGKTPVVIHLAKRLLKAGYSPGIITRGYGGKATHWPQTVNKDSDAVEVGDEPVLMAGRTGVPVVAGPNRNADAAMLINDFNCNVVISDDGMQHYKLDRDIEIVLIDAQRELGNQWCLPAGPLRESAKKLGSVDFVLFNGQNTSSLVSRYQLKSAFEMELTTGKLLPLNSKTKEVSVDDLKHHKIHALTGIGNPERFYSTLEKLGLKFERHSFPDHHYFKESELTFDGQSVIVMTEKDAVKCRGFALKNCYYLPIEASLNNEFDQQLLDKLKAVVAKY